VYDHDDEDVDALGWDEFIARQWESIFAGYRTGRSIRKTGRRWCDLMQAGLGCSQETADLLIRNQIVGRVDRDLEGRLDSQSILAGMYQALADMRTDLTEMIEDGLAAAGLLDHHARLLAAAHSYVYGREPETAMPGEPGAAIPDGAGVIPDEAGAIPDRAGAIPDGTGAAIPDWATGWE
jgi:hypothetical protein